MHFWKVATGIPGSLEDHNQGMLSLSDFTRGFICWFGLGVIRFPLRYGQNDAVYSIPDGSTIRLSHQTSSEYLLCHDVTTSKKY